jgi:hypothetical protein
MANSSVSRRVSDYRKRLRDSGFRLVQLWVPDTHRPGFAEMCRRQSLILRDDPNEAETLAGISEISDTEGWV